MAELWTVFSNKTIKYQLPHTRFDQISDHKRDIYLHGKLFTKILAQAANKTNTNNSFMFMKSLLNYVPFVPFCFYVLSLGIKFQWKLKALNF